MLLLLVDLSMSIALGLLGIAGLFTELLAYCSWGGEIELAILSEHFEIGIDCVDVKTQHVFSYGISIL
jgi:hypothetical protein